MLERLTGGLGHTVLGLGLAAGVVCPSVALAQNAPVVPELRPITQSAAALPGRLDGLVTDERGEPLPGVAITAQGTALQFAVPADKGRFSFYGLRPGPYLVRAVLPGYATSKRELIQVAPAASSWRSIRLSRLAGTVPGANRPVLAASVGDSPPSPAPDTADHDHSAIAWRVRHLKRSVLREEGRVPLADDGQQVDPWLPGSPVDTAASSSSFAPSSGGWLLDLPVSGQVQLLTTSSFDSAIELFSPANIPAGVAYVAIGAPAGSHADWSVQAAIAQGDLSSWTLAGTYQFELADRHDLDVDVAYGWQRYEGGNPLALAAVANGDRNAGTFSVSDHWMFSKDLSVTLGTRFARYAYVEGPAMWSPSAAVKWSPFERSWIRAFVTQSMTAPGAEEFVPTPVGGLWMPAQRTFSPVVPGAPFRPERTRHVEVAFDREFGDVVVTARAFRQRVGDQMVTMFGIQVPDQPRANLGHYFVASGGDVDASGWSVGIARPVASRIRGEIEYSITRADWTASPDGLWAAQWAPSALRAAQERIHDITTTVETEVPETATRVFALYRLSTGFSRSSLDEPVPGFGARFDVQVSQRLPFLDFTTAEWEVLVAVRNLFREAVQGMSIYDELLVVRPPKRIVGGVLVRF